jgi:NAD(P)-dependent dehydrogenase (short-subunit alcohol dehydrogenase family)
MNTVVIGASSGLGRAIAIGLGQRGASVALLARRLDRLTDAAKEAGPDALAIACDVKDAASCQAALDEAAAGLGGIDALIYAPGVGTLGRLVNLTADDWHHTFNTNVIGAALVTNAAMPYLTASTGVAVYLSSVAGSMTAPWPGLGAYAASKAALGSLVEAYRVEHPTVGFTRVIVGDCAGGEGASATEFASGWDMEVFMDLHPLWESGNLLSGALMDVEDLVRIVDAVVQCGGTATIPTVAVIPRRPG